MLHISLCTDVAVFIGAAACGLLSCGHFQLRLKVTGVGSVLRLPNIYRNKGSLHNLLCTFESKFSLVLCYGERKTRIFRCGDTCLYLLLR